MPLESSPTKNWSWFSERTNPVSVNPPVSTSIAVIVGYISTPQQSKIGFGGA
jgi:hypothetical protein